MYDHEMFDYLLEIGFWVNLFGDGALFFIITQGNEEMVRFPIEKGAYPSSCREYIQWIEWGFLLWLPLQWTKIA